MLPVIVLFFLAQRVFIEGVTLTGVRGSRVAAWEASRSGALFGCGWVQDFHARGVLAHGDQLVALANHREETPSRSPSDMASRA